MKRSPRREKYLSPRARTSPVAHHCMPVGRPAARPSQCLPATIEHLREEACRLATCSPSSAPQSKKVEGKETRKHRPQPHTYLLHTCSIRSHNRPIYPLPPNTLTTLDISYQTMYKKPARLSSKLPPSGHIPPPSGINLCFSRRVSSCLNVVSFRCPRN